MNWSIDSIKSSESSINLETLSATEKRIIGAFVSPTCEAELIDAARKAGYLLFQLAGTELSEMTSLNILPL